MSIITFDLKTNSVKKGRIKKKITDYDNYKIKLKSNKVEKSGNINLLSKNIEEQISDGIIYSNKSKDIMIYKFGAKKINQKLVSFHREYATRYLRNNNLKQYSYWIPDLYFVIYGSVNNLSVFSPDFSHAPLSNIYSEETPNSIFGKDFPLEVETFIRSKNDGRKSLYKVCIGGSLKYLGSLSSWEEKMEKFETIVNTFISSSGNSDLSFKAPLARRFFDKYYYKTNSGDVSVHGVLSVYTEFHKNISTLEMYNVWKNTIGSNLNIMEEKFLLLDKEL